MPILLQIFTIISDVSILSFVAYYILTVREKEKRIEKKETKIDTSYHKIVDSAFSKERKILGDAINEADKIIANADYITSTTKETVNKTLQDVALDVEIEAVSDAKIFIDSYKDSLKDIVAQSLSEFEKITKELESDLRTQTQEFRDTLLPGLQKELDEYKQMRMKETDKIVIQVVQKVAQEVLNKTLTISDQETLLTESLEKAKKEGIFE